MTRIGWRSGSNRSSGYSRSGSSGDCNNQVCVNGAFGSCNTGSDCCAPLVCSAGLCTAPQ
ncbi:MAG: hypothetical protein ACLP1X_24790 [Polyangiaceae bacterium]